MNTIKKQLFIFITIITIVLVNSSCTSVKKKFLVSSVVPAAEGTVTVKKDKNNNYHIKIEIDNLADPNRLEPAKEVYVVWMESVDHSVRRLGRMVTSSGLFTSGLKASLETVTTIKPQKVFISAENNAEVTEPGKLVVLTSENLY
jgi:hypothetical protein